MWRRLPTDFWDKWQQDLSNFVRLDLPKIATVLVEALLLIFLLRWVTGRLVRYTHSQSLPSALRAQQLRTVASLATSAGTTVIVFVALMQILDAVHINIGPLLASAGIAAVALGLGAQTIVKDVLNGFFLLIENQYEIGDTIRITAIVGAPITGTVELMTLRRTVLRDPNGALYTVANSQVAIVANLTRDWAQVALHIAVAYSEPSDKVISVLQEVARDIRNDPAFADALVADPEVPGIERVGGAEVDYLMLAKTRPSEQYRVSRELRRRIKECFQRNNIQPAGPARVYVMDQGSTPEDK
jgi:small-conductance mechanosensitive channel